MSEHEDLLTTAITSIVETSASRPAEYVRWLTVPEAAIELGISEAAVRTLCNNRKIEHKREGTRGRGGKGTILIERSVIERHNAIQRVAPLVKAECNVRPRQKRPALRSPHIEYEKWGCV
jgi:hypothetical protein